MQYDLAVKIVECLDEFDVPAEIYEGYSGKGMYGRKTTGVVTNCSLGEILSYVIQCAELFNHYGEPLFDDVKPIESDNLGLEKIYY